MENAIVEDPACFQLINKKQLINNQTHNRILLVLKSTLPELNKYLPLRSILRFIGRKP
jgi:hypothetical protein